MPPVDPAGAPAIALSRFRTVLSKSAALQAYLAPGSQTAEADTLAKVFLEIEDDGTAPPFAIAANAADQIVTVDRIGSNAACSHAGRVSVQLYLPFVIETATSDQRQSMRNLPGLVAAQIHDLGDANGFQVRSVVVASQDIVLNNEEYVGETAVGNIRLIEISADWGVVFQ
jgi:hypothetical protein